MQTLLRDVQYALRQIRKCPLFFSIVVVTLGLGIGVNATIFSMVDWLVLRSLPIKDPQQMHFLAFSRPGADSEIEFSYPEFAEIQKQTTDVFAGMAPFIFGGLAGEQNSQSGLTADGTTKAVQTAYVGGNFFSLLGIAPVAGRFILSTEGKAAGADPVVVLSYNYWQTRFGGDPAIVGKAVAINGHPVAVVGVGPEGVSRADSPAGGSGVSSPEHVSDRARSCWRLSDQSQHSQHARPGATEIRRVHETGPT